MKNPETGNTTVIKVSTQDHSVAVGNSLTIVKDKQVTVNVFDTISITVDAKLHASGLKDASTWLYINSEGFGLKLCFTRST